MELLVVLGIICISQLAGIAGIFWVHKRMLDRHFESIRMLAIFKKAANPGEVAHLVDITDPAMHRAESASVTIEQEDALLPDELSADALKEIRQQMSPPNQDDNDGR